MKDIRLTVCILLLFTGTVVGQSSFSADVDSLILRGMDLTYACQFHEAYETFQQIVDQHPDHLMGYFYLAAVQQSRMMDYETDLWEDEFFTLIDRAIELGERRIEDDNPDAWTCFYLGSSYSFKGLYLSRTGSLLSAFNCARKGQKYLHQAVEMDTILYDTYLLIGSYKYWSGRFYKYFSWLPWISDEREEGVRMVRLCLDRSRFSYWMTLNSLAWIEYDREQYAEAAVLFRRGLEEYPQSRFFLWGLADTNFKLKRFQEAAAQYEDLLEEIRSAVLNNGYNETVCRFKLVKTYMAVKQYAEALAHCQAILSLDMDPRIARRVEDRIEETRRFEKKCRQTIEDQSHKDE